MPLNVHHLDLTVLVFSVLGLCRWLWSGTNARRRNVQGLPLPPGPKGLPVVGNVLDIPAEKPWLTVADWGKKYGDVIYIEILGKPMIFLNSYKAVSDLLDKRSSIYSDRPSFPMLCDVMGSDWVVTFMPYGERFRRIRQYLHRFLQTSKVINYDGIQVRETHRLLADLLRAPNDFVYHLRRSAGAIIMMVAYGHEVAREGDLYVSLAEEALGSMAAAGRPGAFLVDVIPWLKYVPAWFPGANFQRLGKRWREISLAMLNIPYAMTKEKILNGSFNPSMMSQLLETNTDEHGQIRDEQNIASTTAVAYAGGSETTLSALTSFFLAMVLFPEAQKRAQDEIDLVVGKDRLPTFADRDSLPYVECILREILRWNPVIPLLVPHRVTTDDTYNGYFIPEGCTIIVNQWALLHDETEYPDPLAFRPERWLPVKGQAEPRQPEKGVFGFGRRICPGRHLADQSLYIAIVNILATFNIDKALDKDGKPIVLAGGYTSGGASFPEPFECSIKPRSAEAVALINQAVDNGM